MPRNVGSIDRLLRALLGIFLIAAPFVTGWPLFEATWATVVACLAGGVMLAVAASRFCPIYSLVGIKTCKA
ncbi:YgaP family membrane protein [Phaeobacter italicus]|uniref:YgaP family membrane protein n=1 Tax=Phaeobacter italicus TaxID=481446 RepID=UPI00061970A9|nr:DUF2892 domain-containing protein [Phaeobacter italicus]MCA0855791.1 DUF2892 domain-containing protein [Phaeobacter italicus]